MSRVASVTRITFASSPPSRVSSAAESPPTPITGVVRPAAALGRKVGDQFTVPLCRIHHRQVHECSDESAWWTDLEIDAIEIANGLWEESRARRAALVRSLPGAIDSIRNLADLRAPMTTDLQAAR